MVQDNDETAIRSDNGLAFQMVETVRNARASNAQQLRQHSVR